MKKSNVGLSGYKRVKCSQYLYDSNGALVADRSRGMAYDTYDYNLMKNGRLDKLLFDDGYAKATFVSPMTYSFTFYYYNQDHLGNNREVVDADGTVRQVTRSTSGRSYLCIGL